MRQLSAEKRSRIVSARSADAENFEHLLIRRHPRNTFLAINVKLDLLLKIHFSVSAKADQNYQFRAALGHVIEHGLGRPPKAVRSRRDAGDICGKTKIA